MNQKEARAITYAIVSATKGINTALNAIKYYNLDFLTAFASEIICKLTHFLILHLGEDEAKVHFNDRIFPEAVNRSENDQDDFNKKKTTTHKYELLISRLQQ